MKNQILSVIVFFITNTAIYGQNWECIKTGDEYYYGGKQDTVLILSRSIRIDSTKMINGRLFYYNHQALTDGYYSGCYETDGPSFLGKQSYLDISGNYHFINNNNDTLRIYPLAGKNDSWLFYKNDNKNTQIIATVDTIKFDSNFISDSIKIIKFQAQNLNGENINHNINNRIIAISKNYGFWLLFDFRLCPYTIYNHKLYGIKNLKKGYRNFGVEEIWDMEIGDEFHYIIDEALSKTFHVKKVINKWKKNKLYYEYMLWKTYHHDYTGDEITYPPTTYIDSINLNDPMDSRWNTIPGASYISNDIYSGCFDIYFKNDTLYQEKRHCNYGFKKNYNSDSCFHQDIDISGWNGYYLAIKGAGGYYFCGTYNWANHQAESYFELVYYKKGIKIWGNPLKNNFVGEPEYNNENPSILVYPNPALNKIRFDLQSFNKTKWRIEVLDTKGVKKLDLFIDEQLNEINIENLESGLYFYRITGNEITLSGKFIKV